MLTYKEAHPLPVYGVSGHQEAPAEPSGAREHGCMDTSCTPAEERTPGGQDEAGLMPHAHVPFSVRNATLLQAIPFCCKYHYHSIKMGLEDSMLLCIFSFLRVVA